MQNIEIPRQLKKDEFRFLRLNKAAKTPLPGIAWKGGMKWNDIELQDHISSGGNYGVIGGHGNLAILDIDNQEIAEKLREEINTFTIKTCGGTNHFYFIVKDKLYNCVLRGDIGEVRVKNYYVVGPNCYAIDENKGHEGAYEIVSELPIREISAEDFNKIIEPYKRESSLSTLEITDFKDNDTSRSAFEFGVVIDLIKKGYSKSQVFHKMNAFTKWSTAHPQYRELTYEKALSAVPSADVDNAELSAKVWQLLHDKKQQEAIDLMASSFLERRNIFTIKDDTKPEMWIYENGIYVENGFCEINRWVNSFFGRHYKLNTANKIKEKIIAMTYVNQKDFFKNHYPHLLPVKNGLLNLRTAELEEFDPDKIFFSKLEWKYDKDAKIEKIEKFIRDIVADEEQYDTIQEFFGLCLYKEYFLQKAIMLLGPGNNGKSAILNLLTRLIGVENISTLSLDEMNSRGFSTSELFGKMANICGDLSARTLEDTDVFKQLTGGETIGANRKFKSVIYFKNYAKLFSACNSLPKTKDLSDGFFRRWILLEFNSQFVDKEKYDAMSIEERAVNNVQIADTDILNKICTESEIEGFLVWCLAGLQRLIVNKRFTHYEDVDQLRRRWIEKSSSFMEFANRYLEYTGNKEEYVFKEDVDSQYCLYCKHKRLSAETINAQKKYIFDIFGAVEKTRTKKEDNFGHVQKRAYIALKMKPLEVEE
jgi:P4 family phage/plasmid primase-like protien